MATVRVEIEWPPDRGGAGAVAFVRVEDVSFLDAGAVTVAEQVLGDPAQERTRRFLRSYQT